MMIQVSLRRLCMVALLGAVTGCSSVSIEDAVPGARNTGTYPNLNIPQEAATAQLTDEEAAAQLAALRNRRAAQNAVSGATHSEIERLRLLKRTHAERTLEEIEE